VSNLVERLEALAEKAMPRPWQVRPDHTDEERAAMGER
jgi:hypothetical protein